MNNYHRSNDRPISNNAENQSDDSKYDLTRRLLAQLLYNNANLQPRTYLGFPSGHEGHLDLENQIKLCNIIRSSPIANEFRFGSSLGKIYVINTNRYPITSSSMVGIVLSAESMAN